jgi:hypothetical protein
MWCAYQVVGSPDGVVPVVLPVVVVEPVVEPVVVELPVTV